MTRPKISLFYTSHCRLWESVILSPKYWKYYGRRADYNYNSMSEVIQSSVIPLPPEYLAAALVRMEEVAVSNLSKDQYTALFIKIANCKDIHIRRLEIESCKNLLHISPDVFSEALVKLDEIEIERTRLTSEQIRSIEQKIAHCENVELTDLACNGRPLVRSGKCPVGGRKMEDGVKLLQPSSRGRRRRQRRNLKSQTSN